MSKQNRFSIWYPTAGAGSALDILRPIGAGEIGESFTSRSVVYINGPNGEFIPFDVEEAPPTDIPTTDFTFFPTGKLNFLEKMAGTQDLFHMQKRFSPCFSVDNPTGWRTQGRIWHFSTGKVQTNTLAEGPTVRAGGALVEHTVNVSFLTILDFLSLSLTAQTTTEAENLLAVDGIKEKADVCGSGYPGPDKVLFIGCAADGAASANVLYTVTGGGTWAALTNDPFDTAEDAGALAVRSYNDGLRLIVSRTTTDAGSPAEIAYYTSTAFDATTVAAMTATLVNIGSTNGETVTALFWPELGRLYAGTSGGDIYLSTNQGESFTRIYDGSNQINAFAQDRDKGVYAVGASNTILYENSTLRNTFTAKVGPSGGGAFTAIAVAYDGNIYAGNGQSIYKNVNGAKTAGGWSSKKDFGSSRVVKAIYFEGSHKLPNGDSELVRVFVDHTAGTVWDSVDGGNSFQQITSLTNTGYNSVYQGRIGNHYVIVGDVDGTPVGTIHQLAQ